MVNAQYARLKSYQGGSIVKDASHKINPRLLRGALLIKYKYMLTNKEHKNIKGITTPYIMFGHSNRASFVIINN